MLDHTGFVVSDLAKARRFYDAIAKALGLGTIDNGPQAFLLGRSAADNGKPGTRSTGDTYYGAFLLDPDGNNIEACWRQNQ